MNALEALRKGDWVLRLGMFPCFDDAWVIGVASFSRTSPKRVHEHGHEVRAHVWRHQTDSRKREALERKKQPGVLTPTVETFASPIEPAQLQRMLGAFQEVQVPVLATIQTFCLDGVLFEFSVGDPFNRVDLAWGTSGPVEWQALMKLWMASWNELFDVLGIAANQRPQLDEFSSSRDMS